MIVDCYTHTWKSIDQLGRCAPTSRSHPPLPSFDVDPDGADRDHHLSAAEPVATTIVLGFKSRYLDAEIPNEQIASYVKLHPDKLIGFAGVDPTNPKEAEAELLRAKSEWNMPGLVVAPAAQDFHPADTRARRVFEAAQDQKMPVLFHTGIHHSKETKLEYAQPVLLDEIARDLPDMKIIIAHMGYPWVSETLVLLAKHENVYSEISWLLHQPWEAYQTLLSAHQYGVMDKLLFGSGFPSAAASNCIEELYSINHLVSGTNLPTIPREKLRGIVERDTLSLLGISNS